MSGTPKAIDPLRPLDTLIRLLWVGSLLLFVVVPLLALGGSAGDSTEDGFCFETSTRGMPLDDTATVTTGVQNLAPGITQTTGSTVALCVQDMGFVDLMLLLVASLASLAWMLGFLWVTRRLLTRARRNGLFTRDVASDLRRLGWFLLAGGFAQALVTDACWVTVTSHRFTTGYDAVSALLWNIGEWDLGTAIGGVTVLTLARVMDQTVAMREEIDATV